jgi:membrane associated rhomboid family serine protease
MIPIGDDNSRVFRTPVVNFCLMAVNLIVFIFFQQLGSNFEFVMSFSMVPQEILSGKDIISSEGLLASPQPVLVTIFTSMFMHGGIMHIAGNMLYLWIFGDNLENAMGHLRYLLFYLLCGVLAALAHVWASSHFDNGMLVPSLGASGAISGVMGGYLLLFPRNQVRVLFLRSVLQVPAFVSLGLWLLLQAIAGTQSFSSGEQGGGGVAYAAHIGGFVAGLLLAKLFTTGRGDANVKE